MVKKRGRNREKGNSNRNAIAYFLIMFAGQPAPEVSGMKSLKLHG
jgi:hypothetical protein